MHRVPVFCVVTLLLLAPTLPVQKRDGGPPLSLESSQNQLPPNDKPSPPMETELYFSEAPLINQATILNFKVTVLNDAPYTKIEINIPKGFTVVSGLMELTDALVKGQTRVYQIVVVPMAIGHFHFVARATNEQSDFKFGRKTELFVGIDESTSTVSKTDPFATPLTVVSAGVKVSKTRQSSILVDTDNKPYWLNNPGGPSTPSAGQIVVRGRWLFRDKNDVDQPLRDARVEIWERNASATDALLTTIKTNNGGFYESPAIPNNDSEGGGDDIYVKAFSTDDHSVKVTDTSVSPRIYNAQTTEITNVPDGFVDVGSFTITDANRRAYYVYDTIANDAYDFLANNVGWENSYNLQVRWTPTHVGTFYGLGGAIDLTGGDGWDSDVFLHEYGHFVMDKIYDGVFPPTPNCGSHTWDEKSSTGCAWTEGWATFLQAAIQNNRYYDDTDDVEIHWDLEGPSPPAFYGDVEGTITASLWDVFDSEQEPWDSLVNGINGSANNGIWKIVSVSRPNDLQQFNTAWQNSSNGFYAELTSILQHHLALNTTPATSPHVAFSSATYNVNEADGTANITISRTGDLLKPVSVGIRTIDNPASVRCDDNNGSAFARCDYATLVALVQFDSGETQKTISVPLVDDAFVESNESFSLMLTDSQGATIDQPTVASVVIHDNDTQASANPIFSSPFFVRLHYLDFLSREPDTAGFNAWVNLLNGCSDVNNNPTCDRLTVSASFFGSQEFQLKGYFIYRFYALALNRQPQYNEIIPDMSSVTGQTPAEVFALKAAYANAFVLRQEFRNSYSALTNSAYVNVLMGRYSLTSITTPDPAQPDGSVKVTLALDDLVARLNAHTLTRAQVLRAIADSDQVFQLEFNKAFVAMQYYGYLRRTPETAGYQAWLNYLNANPTDFRTMVNGFMNSVEYRLRFGQP